MTHPLSPTSNSFPSPASASRGYDENNVEFPTEAWPSTVVSPSSSRFKVVGESSSSFGKPTPLTLQTHPQSTTIPAVVAPPSVSHSPLPPRASARQQYMNASVGRQLQKPSSSLRDIMTHATTAGKDSSRHSFSSSRTAPGSERPPQQPLLSSSLDSREVQQIRRAASFSRSVNSSTALRSRDPPSSCHSLQSSVGEDMLEGMDPWMTSNNSSMEPDDTEQALFEQRLTQDTFGVAVRKIAQNGKSNLRYVKCVYVDASELVDSDNSSNRSVSSASRRFSLFRSDKGTNRTDSLLKGNKVKVLCWGKKKEVKLPVDKFICVRKGKTTDRSRRNISPATRILSLISESRNCPSLDIEAPTKVDRDKFAKAFSRFLGVPLEGDDVGSVRNDDTSLSMQAVGGMSLPSSQNQQPVATLSGTIPKSHASVDHLSSTANSHATYHSRKHIPLPVVNANRQPRSVPPAQKSGLSPSSSRLSQQGAKEAMGNTLEKSTPLPIAPFPAKTTIDVITSTPKDPSVAGSQPTTPSMSVMPIDDDASAVSSITGVGYDQDLVEELHSALAKLKKELDDSRAEAARAVKVAEQAIQSAEKSSSKDWNSTVTHKAAEAAAIAQKRSAEALAKARHCEERLLQEKKKASLWRKQAEAAAEEAGQWQTRAAVAEVQRAAMAESLESQRHLGVEQLPATESEVDRLRSKLAVENAMRRKLLNEVQDLRGQIRVYCRPRQSSGTPVVSAASQEVLILHRERESFSNEENSTNTPLSFEFDGILPTDSTQQDVYGEMEAVCLSALDGYNSCIMAYGQAKSGKTYTMIGDISYDEMDGVSIENYGIHLQAARQFFSVLKQRSDLYEETLTFSVVEVYNERLSDLLAGTETGESRGVVETGGKSRSRRQAASTDGSSQSDTRARLEIRTNRDGETSVYGQLSVSVESFEDFLSIWIQILQARRQRLQDQGIDFDEHKSNSHLMATLKVQSKKIDTGLSITGQIQFVDLAASNVIARRASGKKASTPESVIDGIGIGAELKFTNRSIATLSEVMTARSQFHRLVPYRNATITHLLSDSLEADTKVVMIVCASSDLQDLQETTCALKLAQIARKVVIGKATKHTNSEALLPI